MTYKCIMGVDPGLSGAVAFYFPDRREGISAYDVPVVGKEIDASALYDLIINYNPDLAVVEIVHSMTKQGSVLALTLGAATASLKALLGLLKFPLSTSLPPNGKDTLVFHLTRNNLGL